MSVIKQLEISGIRSYKPGMTQKLEFYNPLTLIIGPNGSGKTTIVEALKYIITNEQPPNSKNGAFLYDINLLNKSKTGLLNKIESHVKIHFVSLMDNKEYQLIRRLLQTRTDSKVNIRTLETTLTCLEELNDEHERFKKQRLTENSLNNLKDEVLQNKILSSGAKIADADKTILYHLNLTKALVDNVLLVHQNDSTWPLSDSINIKKRMDAILDSEKYIKLIEDLKLERRRLNNQTKLLEQQYEFSKTLKNKAQSVLNELEDDKTLLKKKSLDHNTYLNQLNVYEISRKKYTNSLDDLEFKINLLRKSEEKLKKLKIDLEILNSKDYQLFSDTPHDILNKTIEELQNMIILEKENTEEMEKENKIYATKKDKIKFLKQETQTTENEINKRVLEINEKEKEAAAYFPFNLLNISLLNKNTLNYYLVSLKNSITKFMEEYYTSLNTIEKYENIKDKLKELEELKTSLINKRSLSKPEINYTIEIKCKEKEIETQKQIIKEAYAIYSSPEFQFRIYFEENHLKDFKNINGTFNLFKYEECLKEEIENHKKNILRKQRINTILWALNNLITNETTETELFAITKCEDKRNIFLHKAEEVSKNQFLLKKINKNDISNRIYIKLKENGLKKNKCPLCNTSLENNEEFTSKMNKLIFLLKEHSDKLRSQVIETTGDYKSINESLKILKDEEDFLKEIEISELKGHKGETIEEEEKDLKEKECVFENFLKYKSKNFKEFNLNELNNKMDLLISDRDSLKNSFNEFEKKNLTENDVYFKRRLNELHLEICNLKIEEEKIPKEIKETSKNTLLKRKEDVSKIYHHIKFNIKEVIKMLEKKENLEKELLLMEKSLKNLNITTENKNNLNHLQDALNYKQLIEKTIEFEKFYASLKNIFCSLEENFNELENNEVALNLSRIISTLEEYPVSDFNDTGNYTDLPDSSMFDTKTYLKEEITDSLIFDEKTYLKENREEIGIFYEPEKMLELQNLLKFNLHKLETMHDNLEISKNKLLKKIEEKNKVCYILEGETKQLNKTIENKKNLFNTEYIYAEKNLNKNFLELKIHELYILDISDIIICSEKAIGDYHKEKIQEINESLKILWENTCDNDIENIEMKMEFNKTYNYKLVMHKKVQIEGDIKTVEIDMRGRCSAGQSMIASILFRLALCENFIKNPTIFALDEPTTNLDDDNVEALGNTFRILLDAFKSHQFVIITHDERFMSMIQTGDAFYKLHRLNGECIIQNANLL